MARIFHQSREKLFLILFTTETKPAKLFDVVLIFAILLNCLLVMLDSVEHLRKAFHQEMYFIEWVLTLGFTVEYFLRIYAVRKKLAYMRSFFGVVDLCSILPTYISLIFPGTESLIVLRLLRIFRIFRILKLIRFISESSFIMEAVKNSRFKIYIFLFSVLNIAVIFGSIMYVVEGPENGFTSIPKSIYWAIVTMTTVGYGDIYPNTVLGQMITTVIILMGYGIIAVPTGIVSSEMTKIEVKKKNHIQYTCQRCMTIFHDDDALYCKHCGNKLDHPSSVS